MSFFRTFDLVETYDLDLTDLENRYLSAMKEGAEVSNAGDDTVVDIRAYMLNAAYDTLRDNLKRCEHLLDMVGVDHSKLSVDKSFYESILMIKDELDETDSPDEIERLADDVDMQIASCDSFLKEYMNLANLQDVNSSTRDEAIGSYVKLKYLRGLRRHFKHRSSSVNGG